MSYYIIAGEKSGDLHGANLMRAMQAIDPECEFHFCGGDAMLKESQNISIHFKDMAFMGFVEILKNLGKIKQNIKKVKRDLIQLEIKELILIDYPGFNLRIAEFAKSKGIKVHYYISPKVWAWKEKRVQKIKAFVDEMYLILPFEKDFYKKHKFETHYVGNPLLDEVKSYQAANPKQEQKDKTLALLPGSRKMEVQKILPEMVKAAKHFPALQVKVAGVKTLDTSLYQDAKNAGFEIVYDKTYDLLNIAHCALVTSGTATLETALFNVPQVVCYKAHPVSVWIARKLVKLKFISLVNLIMDQAVVCELIQEELNESKIVEELQKITIEGHDRTSMLKKYEQLEQLMGEAGASKKVAKLILGHA